MTTRETRLAGGVILTCLSFLCFSAMNEAERQSNAATGFNIAGYLLAGLALGMLYRAFRTPT